MKRRVIICACFVVVLAGCRSSQVAIPDWQLIEGVRVTDPHNPSIRYYFASSDKIMRMLPDTKKYAGLWRSEDNGQQWEYLSTISGFEVLFVHPKTGRLYAIILESWLRRGPNGTLEQCGGRKIAMSQDGHVWKDITPSNGHVPNAFMFLVDPDNSDRVCFFDSLDLETYQSSDADYLNWRVYQRAEWAKLHPDSTVEREIEKRGGRLVPHDGEILEAPRVKN